MPTNEFEEQLQAALITRPAIEQAKGVLAHHRCATPEQAFAEMRHVAQDHNVKVNALANALLEVASGQVPEDPQLRKVIWQEWRDLSAC